MSPSAGALHALVAKNLMIARLALKQASAFVNGQLTGARQASRLNPALARIAPQLSRHPAAIVRHNKRCFSHSAERAVSRQLNPVAKKIRYDRSSFPTSRIGSAVHLSSGRAPFANALRPNLTGGALGRTAGGYSVGGGARYFSHGPAAPTHVIQNVSQAVRTFVTVGNKAQFSGMTPRDEKRYCRVTKLQSEVSRKISGVPRATPGSLIGFAINPSITALPPFGSIQGSYKASQQKMDHLNTEGLFDSLSIDFSRALKELAIVLNDLKKLSRLGDLPITYQGSRLCVHFPGCDANIVERLAEDLGLQRGIITQDQDFDAFNDTDVALLFPFAPSKSPSVYSSFQRDVSHWQGSDRMWWDDPAIVQHAPPSPILGNLPTPDFSTASHTGSEEGGIRDAMLGGIPWFSPSSGNETAHSSELVAMSGSSNASIPLEYQGLEGIFRFMEELDAADRKGFH